MKSSWTWWRIGSALFVLTLLTGGTAFVWLLVYDIPRMISGESRTISTVSELMFNITIWPASPLILVAFLLGALVKDDSDLDFPTVAPGSSKVSGTKTYTAMVYS